MRKHAKHCRRIEEKALTYCKIWRNAELLEIRMTNEYNWEQVIGFTREPTLSFQKLSRKSNVPKGNQKSCWEVNEAGEMI
jgi:hypothetical protein